VRNRSAGKQAEVNFDLLYAVEDEHFHNALGEFEQERVVAAINTFEET
jgi:hypothetical protein